MAEPGTHVWENNIVDHVLLDPRTLKPHPRNPRMHPQAQTDALESSLEVVGWIDEPTVNITTGYLTDGHERVELAIARGELLIPVKRVRLTVQQELDALLLKDPIGQMAVTDGEKMSSLIAESAAANRPQLESLMAELRERAGLNTGPLDLEQMAEQYPEPDPSVFWPVISLRVPPEVHARYLGILEAMAGATDVERFVALLDAAEAA